MDKHGTYTFDLILIDGVSHAGIGAEIDVGLHFFEYNGGVFDQIVRYPGVNVAAADKDRHFVKRAWIVPGMPRGPISAPLKTNRPAYFLVFRATYSEARQAPWEKPPKADLLIRKTFLAGLIYQCIDNPKAEDRSGSLASRGQRPYWDTSGLTRPAGIGKLTPSMLSASARETIDLAVAPRPCRRITTSSASAIQPQN